MGERYRDALAVGLALAAGVIAQHGVLGLELVGWDSYPLVAASRAEGPAELLRGLGDPWMDGRYPRGLFHRPVTELSVAIDHGVWGLDPFGYQLSNLLSFLFAVAALFALARIWLGDRLAAGIAALLFALHPAQLEIVPVTARRGELLSLAFASLTLVAIASPRRSGKWIAALLALLAAGAKETGAFVLPVAFAAACLVPHPGTARQRMGAAARRVAPLAAALALLLAARLATLGELGGHPASSLVGAVLRGLGFAPVYLRSTLLPQPWLELPVADAAISWLLLAVVVVAIALARPLEPRVLRIFGVVCVWWLVLLALAGASGDLASWYAAPFAAPTALLLAAPCAAAWRARRGGAAARSRTVGALGAIAVLGMLFRSSAWTHYAEWTEVDRRETAFLALAHDAIRDGADGSTVRVEGLPVGTGTPLERIGVRSALGMSDYGLAAWAELHHPERRVRVVLRRTPDASAPEPGVLTLDAVPQPSPLLDRLLGPER